MAALMNRCDAAGIHIADAMRMASIQVRRCEKDPDMTLDVSRRCEAAARLMRTYPRLPFETAHTLVRIAVEGVRAEDAGW